MPTPFTNLSYTTIKLIQLHILNYECKTFTDFGGINISMFKNIWSLYIL